MQWKDLNNLIILFLFNNELTYPNYNQVAYYSKGLMWNQGSIMKSTVHDIKGHGDKDKRRNVLSWSYVVWKNSNKGFIPSHLHCLPLKMHSTWKNWKIRHEGSTSFPFPKQWVGTLGPDSKLALGTRLLLIITGHNVLPSSHQLIKAITESFTESISLA